MNNYAKLLREKKKKIGVWGAGYIGYSTMAHYAHRGVVCLALDVVPEKVEAVNRGELAVVGLQEWLGIDVKPMVQNGLIAATLDVRRMLQDDVLVHFLAIPTEKDGKPYLKYLEEVIGRLSQLETRDSACPPLIIVESTLVPGTTDKLVIPVLESKGLKVGRDVLIGIAPRRDWFVDNTKSLADLDRVYGGCNEAATQAMKEVLGIVCSRLHSATNHRSVEIVKSVENAYRHVEITLANQLSLAYPNSDLREALRLVGTKWNIGTFYPGFGSGGYCIPLSSQYVLAGAERPEELTILSNTVRTDTEINRRIAQSIIQRGYRSVGILGLSYKANLKVSILSPTLPFTEELRRAGVVAKICDPFYSDDEIRRLAQVDSFAFPAGLEEFDAIVAVVDHRQFREGTPLVLGHMKKVKFLLDNMGMWRELTDDFSRRNIEYHVAGDANWLEPKTK